MIMGIKIVGVLLGVLLMFEGWSQETNMEWINQTGGSDWEQSNGIAIDSEKKTYVVGHFDGTSEFGSGDDAVILSSTGLGDIFIQKANSDGEHLWVKQIGGELLN